MFGSGNRYGCRFRGLYLNQTLGAKDLKINPKHLCRFPVSL
ncbi:MAG: hypothetical protein RJA95_769 [Verrucomicrobiota bacterium]|jgi:hypothetical protein